MMSEKKTDNAKETEESLRKAEENTKQVEELRARQAKAEKKLLKPKEKPVLSEKTVKTRKPKRKIKPLQIVGNILFCLCLAIFALTTFYSIKNYQNPEESFLFGYKPQLVKSDSMAPTLSANSLILVKKASYESIRLQDIVTYKTDYGAYICHRVIEISDAGFVTKGDYNSEEDPMIVDRAHYLGKLVGHTAIFAGFFGFLSAPSFAGVLLYILLPLAVIAIVVFGHSLWKNRKEKGEPKPRVTEKRIIEERTIEDLKKQVNA